MSKEPESDSEERGRPGITPAALGYLSLLAIPAVAWGAGKVLHLLSGWMR